jgi:hypothetical protein
MGDNEYRDTRVVVEAILERCGQIASELWSWDETNPVFFDNEDIFLEDAYEAAYLEIMKAMIENHMPPNEVVVLRGKERGEA